MGRRRRTDLHLPGRLYLEHGAYYFRMPGQPRKNLGRDLADALTAYGGIIGANWTGRTVGDAIDRYRQEILPAKRSADTRRDQGAQLNKLKIGFGHLLPDNVTAQLCYKYADARRSKKTGMPVPIQARHEISLLGHVFGKMIKWGMTSHNPAKDVKLERSPKQRGVTMAEVEALKKRANAKMAAIIDFAVSIGQRRGDLLTLKVEDLREELHIDQGKTGAKIDMERTAALNEIVGRLMAFKPDIPKTYLIRKGNGQPYTPDGFSSNWKRLMGKHVAAGGQHFTFHRLRSVSADGGTIEEAQARLGHASPTTTRRFYRNTAVKAKPRE